MTSKKIATEIKTVWDGSWAEKLNEVIAPRLKGIYFDTYQASEGLPGGQILVKIVCEATPEYFKNELKTGRFNSSAIHRGLEALIWLEQGFHLHQRKPKGV